MFIVTEYAALNNVYIYNMVKIFALFLTFTYQFFFRIRKSEFVLSIADSM